MPLIFLHLKRDQIETTIWIAYKDLLFKMWSTRPSEIMSMIISSGTKSTDEF